LSAVFHPHHQSRLYCVKSPAQLADHLGVAESELQRLLGTKDNFLIWPDKKSGRLIEEPKPRLRIIHDRVADLLARIEPPSYLYSAVKGRSYISNAQQHDATAATVKIDIRRFYPSIRAANVYHFFLDHMKCAGDVAGMLTKLLTVSGHLPTGSSVSPILSFYAHLPMFEEINALALANGSVMTCYVDDMVFSGPGAAGKMLFDVRRVLKRYRLWGHKTKKFKPGQPKVLTGVAITRHGPKLPNRQHQKIKDDLVRLAMATSDEIKVEIAGRLMSRMYAAACIDPERWKSRAEAMKGTRKGIARRIEEAKRARYRAIRAPQSPWTSKAILPARSGMAVPPWAEPSVPSG